jgi:hypothetical protein
MLRSVSPSGARLLPPLLCTSQSSTPVDRAVVAVSLDARSPAVPRVTAELRRAALGPALAGSVAVAAVAAAAPPFLSFLSPRALGSSLRLATAVAEAEPAA